MKAKRFESGGLLEQMRGDMAKAYKDTDAAYKHMKSMDEASKPAPPPKKMMVPQDIDGASATRSPKKGEKIKYEEPGSGIIVDGKPIKKMAAGGSASSRADGIAMKGKTRGTMIMCGGGMTKGKR
jgi:hypothetical protein